MLINLDTLSPSEIGDFFGSLIKFIYASYSIEFVRHKRKNYFNCSNTWHGGDPGNGKKYCHQDIECDGYSDCELEKENIEIDMSTLKYFYTKHFDEDDEDISNELVKNIHDFLQSKNNFTFKSSTEIILKNINGFNDDHRGSDHVIFNLPFEPTINLGSKFKFLDLVDACYRIKSHKFDNWYELYCGIKEITKQNNTSIIKVNFDHGS
jgi:hypothetical protein